MAFDIRGGSASDHRQRRLRKREADQFVWHLYFVDVPLGWWPLCFDVVVIRSLGMLEKQKSRKIMKRLFAFYVAFYVEKPSGVGQS